MYAFVGKTIDKNSSQHSTKENSNEGVLGLKDGTVLSLAALQQRAVNHSKENVMDYQQHVLDYVKEWEEIVTKMIKQELVIVKKLHRDRLHYEKKVEGLHRNAVKAESKGKDLKLAEQERIVRNEQKLKDSFQLDEQKASQVCFLIEQVTIDGWKDFYPLVKNTMKFEVNRLGRENSTYGQMLGTLDAMKSSHLAESIKDSY